MSPGNSPSARNFSMRPATGSAMPRLETKAVEGHRSPRRWRVFQWPPNLAQRLGLRQSFRLRGAPERRFGATAASAFPP
jgi:hypothetical protein